MISNFNHYMKRYVLTSLIVLCSFALFNCSINKNETNRLTKFAVSFDASVQSEPASGRILLLFSSTERFSPGPNGTPVFGLNVDDLKPGEAATIEEDAFGYPVRSLREIPAGDYYVQSYLNVYTTFSRSDGHTVKLHMDQGEGQKWRQSPGNLFSEPQMIHFDPQEGTTIPITMDQKIPPISLPEDTEWVKTVQIESKLLSDFWGQPMHLGARILLPKGFDEHPDAKYPGVYIQGHHSRGTPGGFRDQESNALYQAWTSDDFPRILLVTFQHATPYYDDSYGVDSENVGPYGSAITQELIPYIEEKFRGIGKPYSRVLTGGSTGGWISLAMQVWNPDFFGGTWSFYPDQVDFRKYQTVNIYEDDNAYYVQHEWTDVARSLQRRTDGQVRSTIEQWSLSEEAAGDRYRSGGQLAIFNAVFAPVAEDGYPEPLWDPLTGEINHEIAEWAKEHFDIRYYLENNWAAVGPKLVGKINIFCGRMDDYYLNEAVYLLEDFLESTADPYYAGRIEYGARGGHGWSPWGRGRVPMYREMADHITKNAPPGENTDSWKYK